MVATLRVHHSILHRPLLPRRSRLSPRASLPDAGRTSKTQREMKTESAGALVVAPLLGFSDPVRSEEPALSEWERVFLPIDPNVVLLDVAFVPDDPDHVIE